jgi:preprotein translocase subunit SecY
VVPVIFASSLLYVPVLAGQLLGNQGTLEDWVDRYLSPGATVQVIYFLAFSLLILAFTFFYAWITFNPAEIADTIRRYGGFLPGLRPGRPTAGYLGYVLARLTAAGAAYLAAVAMFPLVALGRSSQALPSGVSLLIVVGVGLDTVRQIEGQLQQHRYDAITRPAGNRLEPRAALRH